MVKEIKERYEKIGCDFDTGMWNKAPWMTDKFRAAGGYGDSPLHECKIAKDMAYLCDPECFFWNMMNQMTLQEYLFDNHGIAVTNPSAFCSDFYDFLLYQHRKKNIQDNGTGGLRHACSSQKDGLYRKWLEKLK